MLTGKLILQEINEKYKGNIVINKVGMYAFICKCK